jgi:hypothetical protein
MSWTEQVSSQTTGTTNYVDFKYSRGIVVRPTLVKAPEGNVIAGADQIKVYEVKQVKQRLSDAEQPACYFSIPLLKRILAIDPGQDLLVLASRLE